jgi:hypothetical protein
MVRMWRTAPDTTGCKARQTAAMVISSTPSTDREGSITMAALGSIAWLLDEVLGRLLDDSDNYSTILITLRVRGSTMTRSSFTYAYAYWR